MNPKKILLLGSGELGKEFTIASQRTGQHVIAVDKYEQAPAMQVADENETIDMLDGDSLDQVVEKYQPDLIVPEIEAIATHRFYTYENQGYHVVPSAKAANFTMDRRSIRDLAAQELGLKTAKYRYADSYDSLKKAVEEVGTPCVVKPLMSSSGKGQSTVKDPSDIEKAWNEATEKGRGKNQEVIVEGFVDFDSEITLLTVTQENGNTFCCPPIGHVQKGGDYQASWQPAEVSREQLKEAEEMAQKVTESLGGSGIWGVEFFLAKDGVYFSELSPRPHDTGMVTLAGSQGLNEFELHMRAILGLPIPEIGLQRKAVSSVILAEEEGHDPVFEGIEEVLSHPGTDIRLFGKKDLHPGRRMGVVLLQDTSGQGMNELIQKAQELAAKVKVKPSGK